MFTPAHLDDMVLSCLVAIAYEHNLDDAFNLSQWVQQSRYDHRERAILRGEKEHEGEMRLAWLHGIDGQTVHLRGHPLFELRRG